MICGRGRAVLRSESKMKILTFSMVCFASVIRADDFKTIDGKEYKNVTVSRVEPDGIVLITSSGISKIYFTELPKEAQEHFHYDGAAAAAYAAQEAANYAALQRQQEEAMRQQAETRERTNKYIRDQIQAGVAAQNQQEKVVGLQARYDGLHREEDDLFARIQDAKRLPKYLHGQSGTKHYSYLNPAWQTVPDWERRLSDVRQEKREIRRQLQEAQRH